MAQEPRVTVHNKEDVSVIAIEGNVTAFAEESIQQAYHEVVDTREKILLSFRDGDHINSAGIAILIDLVSDGNRKGKTIRIAHPDDHFQKIFKMVGLTEYAGVFAGEEEGLENF